MKIYHLNKTDTVGGAARAAYRLHCALRERQHDSKLLVDEARFGDWTVETPNSKWKKRINLLRSSSGGLFGRVLKTSNMVLHSPAVLPSEWPSSLNASDADLLHLHWVNGEMMSIAGIGKLRKPVVWTLHDMWAFCGAEHYTDEFRWRDGYLPDNRPEYESGFDLNRWVWSRKLRHWQRPFSIVTPSRWLADCARASVLMREWPVTVVPNAINTNLWRPFDKALSRQLLRLPPEASLLLFGAMGGSKDPRKGFDLLRASLLHLASQDYGLELVIFGERTPRVQEDLGFPVHYMGHLSDDVALCLMYSAADAMVVPSRQDNLPNTVMEALTCGTPVIAFRTGGMPDMIENRTNGYLAQPFAIEDLACGIQWVLEDQSRQASLSTAARQRAVQYWSNEVIAEQYVAVYKNALQAQA